MELQITILKFFQDIGTPFLDLLANIITMFGEQTLIIGLAAMIFWCIDKRKGYTIGMILLTSITTMGILKDIVKYPRPFQVIPSIEGKRIATATGYSFPSGHTVTAAGFYTSLSLAYRKRVISIICAVLILLVAISRIYLGVHWPLDVFAALVLGIGLSTLLYNRLYDLTGEGKQFLTILLWGGIISSVITVFLSVILTLGKGDATGLTDLTKTLALASGSFWAAFLEVSCVHFKTDGTLFLKILRFSVGFAGVILIMLLKEVFPSTMIFTSLRYFLTGLWIFGIYPLLGSKVGLFTF